MRAPKLLVFGAIAFIASVPASHAGPCTDDIDKMQARIDAKLQAKEAAGPTGRQVGASTHVQPTPRSIGAAEAKLGEGRLKRLRLSGKPCCVRAPPIALVTKTRADKHSRKCNVR